MVSRVLTADVQKGRRGTVCCKTVVEVGRFMGRSKGVVTVVEVCTYMSSDMQPNTFACSMYVRICGGPIMELHSLATVAGAVQCKLHRQDGKCAHCTQCEVVGIALYPV